MRVVLVTGSTSGIGKETALRFSQAGDSVVFNSVRSVREGEELASQVPGSLYVQADISNDDDCTRLVREVLDHYGSLDVLVNNAGTTRVIPHHDLASASVDAWREIFEVNVFGTWNLSVTAMEALRAAKGSIVNVSSAAGVRPTGSSIPYAASKAALNHMTALLAKVVGPEVRVNAVAPGFIETPMTAVLDEKVSAAMLANIPLSRRGTDLDVAQAVKFLASDAASYITGHVLDVNGGMFMGG